MSRGGTRKARGVQEERRRKREREARAEASERRKRERKKRAKPGRGRAALLHLSGVVAPFTFSFGLFASGVAVGDEEDFWMADLIDRASASYFVEPLGFVYLVLVGLLSAGLFALAPVALWRRLYRDRPLVDRDWSSVDSAFTLLAVTSVVWLLRAAAGYNTGISRFAEILTVLTIYVPIFSALLAVGMPVVPGSGRIGGILPNFMRIKFTERYLLENDERAAVEAIRLARKRDSERSA